jgi:hypothetical protein
MSLEQELRRALRRTDPSSGFDDRVLAKIASGESVQVARSPNKWARLSLPIAASVMLAVGATYYVQHQEHQQRLAREHAHAEQAAREVVFALQIASDTVAAAQAKVEEITRYEPTNDN